MIKKQIFTLLGLILVSVCLWAEKNQEGAEQEETIPGIHYRLGENIPLDIPFVDTEGNTVILKDIITRPTIISLVYFNCPTICHPMMAELGRVAQLCDLQLGEDYNIINLSINETEDYHLAKQTKQGILSKMQKEVPPKGWYFLTGKNENIIKLADGLGYYFKDQDENFIHPSAIVFVSKQGKIVRYKSGLAILTADIKMGVATAIKEQPLSIMENLTRLCFAQDAEGKAILLKFNRVILAFTLFLVFLFVLFLIFHKDKPKKEGSKS